MHFRSILISKKFPALTIGLLLLCQLVLTAQTKVQWALWEGHEDCGVADSMIYKKDFTKSLCTMNFSKIWTCRHNLDVVGFIGDNYQRLQIKFISVTKDSLNPCIYWVKGKSKVSSHICDFNGKLTINIIKCIKPSKDWADVKKRGILFGDYSFYEDSAQNASGFFKGSFASTWFITKNGQLAYDSLAYACDMYCNNQFAGTWHSYKQPITKTCNWGDFRIPFSGDLDFGAGEFSPNEKYKMNGWESYQVDFDTEEEMKRAEMNSEKWWK